MLILTRRPQESIMIGDDVVLTVISIKGNQVRLGFEAPKEISIHREEIYHKIGSTKHEAGHQLNPEDNGQPSGNQ